MPSAGVGSAPIGRQNACGSAPVPRRACTIPGGPEGLTEVMPARRLHVRRMSSALGFIRQGTLLTACGSARQAHRGAAQCADDSRKGLATATIILERHAGAGKNTTDICRPAAPGNAKGLALPPSRKNLPPSIERCRSPAEFDALIAMEIDITSHSSGHAGIKFIDAASDLTIIH